ncbi:MULTISPECIES: hypothetical protein [Shewanella]|jgi:hypothetical protein|uniref:hypothetical protein n=1 Tax=Shewanella TaxID=22 RepID=UPI0016733159|nr:hypothetical protein [Shewanella fodinae]MCL2907559.1 hypothetical protein [Shewanella fodinae]GGZ09752.1 hypothetical protein GCM10007169_27940 [Shewanella fodinae]
MNHQTEENVVMEVSLRQAKQPWVVPQPYKLDDVRHTSGTKSGGITEQGASTGVS